MSDSAVASWRVRELLVGAVATLEQAGCATPRLDAEVLLADALRVGRAQLVLDRDEKVAPDAATAFAALVTRRVAREPVAYIVGRREFRWVNLRCDRRALVPRPETELLVEVGLTLPGGSRVLDVGTGSGAVAVALKHERPDLDVVGVDTSEEALSLARENAQLLCVDVTFVRGEFRAGLECDAVLANLPYVEPGAVLDPEITGFEPPIALYGGGSDGLELIRAMIGELDGVGFVALEHGFEQGAAVAGLLRSAGFEDVRTLADLAGHPRVTVGRR
ncbi:MAG: peptide chain release factor N(5)-glutamine methyltransferase [Solirubrobacteraceae bacterium]